MTVEKWTTDIIRKKLNSGSLSLSIAQYEAALYKSFEMPPGHGKLPRNAIQLILVAAAHRAGCVFDVENEKLINNELQRNKPVCDSTANSN